MRFSGQECEITHLEEDLVEEDPWMALACSLTLLESDLDLALAPFPGDGQIVSCLLGLDLDLRTRQGRSPADFWLDGWVLG